MHFNGSIYNVEALKCVGWYKKANDAVMNLIGMCAGLCLQHHQVPTSAPWPELIDKFQRYLIPSSIPFIHAFTINFERRWTQSSFIQPQSHPYDRFLWDPIKRAHTVDKFVDDLRERYGGVDSILIWPTYTNIGIDDRNQVRAAFFVFCFLFFVFCFCFLFFVLYLPHLIVFRKSVRDIYNNATFYCWTLV